MKTNQFFLAAFAAFTLFATSSSARDKFIPEEQLPASAQAFLSQNCPNDMIVYVEKDGIVKTSYEVYLDNGLEIKFDRNGEWYKIDSDFAIVPAGIVPAAIRNSVQANYGGEKIAEIERAPYGYNVELANGLELMMTSSGQTLR